MTTEEMADQLQGTAPVDPGVDTERPTPTDPVPVVTPPAPAADASAIADALREGFRNISADFGGRRVEQAAPRLTIEQQINSLSPDQRMELEAKIAANPLQGSMMLAKMMAQEQVGQLGAQIAPYAANQGEMLIDSFVSGKRSEDAYAKQIEGPFRQSIAGLDRTRLAQMSHSERSGELSMRWDAAAGQVFRNAAQSGKPVATAAPVGSRTAGAPTSQARKSVFEDPGLAALAARTGLTAEDMQAIQDEME